MDCLTALVDLTGLTGFVLDVVEGTKMKVTLFCDELGFPVGCIWIVGTGWTIGITSTWEADELEVLSCDCSFVLLWNFNTKKHVRCELGKGHCFLTAGPVCSKPDKR